MVFNISKSFRKLRVCDYIEMFSDVFDDYKTTTRYKVAIEHCGVLKKIVETTFRVCFESENIFDDSSLKHLKDLKKLVLESSNKVKFGDISAISSFIRVCLINALEDGRIDSKIFAKYNNFCKDIDGWLESCNSHFDNDLVKEDLSESSGLSQVLRKLRKYDIGCITAYRNPSTVYGDSVTPNQIRQQNEKNNNNQQQLKAYFVRKGYSVVDVVGFYQEDGMDHPSKERSILVADYKKLGTLRDDLVIMGKKYKQDSIFFKPLNGKSTLMYMNGREEILEDGDFKTTIGVAWSKIRGHEFVIESCEPNAFWEFMTPTSKLSTKILSEKEIEE